MTSTTFTVKEMIQDDKSLLQSFVEKDAKVVQLEEMLLQKDVIIKSLKEELFSKTTLNKSTELMQKEEKIKTLSNTLLKESQELSKATEYAAALQ